MNAVQAFVLVADLGSFTKAADAMETSQAAISLKLKRLEDRLGYRLMDRTPRRVALSAGGHRFIGPARELLIAHERAIAKLEAHPPRRLILGISDHVAGADLPMLLSRITQYDPLLVLEVRIAPSRDLIVSYDRGDIDAAIVRQEGDRDDGEVLVHEPFAWFAAPDWHYRSGEPLRLANMAAPCGVRGVAVRALDDAGIPWTEVFIGGGVMAVGAAISAGMGVAALARRVAPAGVVDVGETFGLPPLPSTNIVLHARVSDPRSNETLNTLGASFRSAISQRY